MTRIQKLLRLPLADTLLLMQMALLLLLIRVALVCLPFQTVRHLLKEAAAVGRCRQEQKEGEREWRRIAWAATTMSRYIANDRPCLPQALATQFLLQRRGYPTVLRIGVIKKDNHPLQAHAWLESPEGNVIVGGSLSPLLFTPLPPLIDIDR